MLKDLIDKRIKIVDAENVIFFAIFGDFDFNYFQDMIFE